MLPARDGMLRVGSEFKLAVQLFSFKDDGDYIFILLHCCHECFI